MNIIDFCPRFIKDMIAQRKARQLTDNTIVWGGRPFKDFIDIAVKGFGVDNE